MTAPRDPLERAEDGLRALYINRDAAPTTELRTRIGAVTTTESARRFVWLRSPFGALAVVGVIVLALVAAGRLRELLQLPAPPDVGAVPASYDPAHPPRGLAALTGLTFDGISGAIAWILTVALLLTLLAVLLLGSWRLLTGRSARTEHQPGPRLTRKRFGANIVMGIVVFLAFSALRNVSLSPLEPGSTSGSGLGVTQARDDGIDPFLLQFRPGLVDVTDQPPVSGSSVFDGPRSVYAVAPGQPLTYMVSVKNSWPIGIRLVGRWRDSSAPTDATEPIGATPAGLSLLREENVLDWGPESTKPFAPVDLAPGQEVTLVVAEVARDCADPAKVLPARHDAEPITIPAIQFVFETFGIQGIATVGLSPEVTVPSNCP
jgi:hypothetical protein